jgi:hypothetical protein
MAAPMPYEIILDPIPQGVIQFPHFSVKLTPKMLGERVIVDVREFQQYKTGGRVYPTKTGIFLYPSQFNRIMELDDEQHFQVQDAQSWFQAPEIDIGYDATVQSDSVGGITITIPSKKSDRHSMRILGSQFAEIRNNAANIKANIEALKEFARMKKEAAEQLEQEESDEADQPKVAAIFSENQVADPVGAILQEMEFERAKRGAPLASMQPKKVVNTANKV